MGSKADASKGLCKGSLGVASRLVGGFPFSRMFADFVPPLAFCTRSAICQDSIFLLKSFRLSTILTRGRNSLLDKMGNIDPKASETIVHPLSKCCSDCSRYCLDECDCDWQCGCVKLKIQTHHTPSAEEHASKTPADEDFISVNESE